jgi:phosphohistidine swiveling domain-containing protein
MHSGKWRIKPSGKLPVFLRYVINSSFTKGNAKINKIKRLLENRVYLHHMMYWKATEYNPFETEIIGHLKKNDGWFEGYVKRELADSEFLYKKGLELKKTDWTKQATGFIKKTLDDLLEKYRIICCAWYVQYPLDEYFESTIEEYLLKYINADDRDFRKYVLIFSDPKNMTEVAQERWRLTKLAKEFFRKKENLNKPSLSAKNKILDHLDKFAYINRGLATSKPYSFQDIVKRLKELKTQILKGESIDNLIYQVSEQKVKDDYKWALKRIKPKPDFLKIIKQARKHSYMRNRRVEAFFNADYGANFMYQEIARRAKFNPNWIMDVSVPEMYDALDGKKLPNLKEMKARQHNYAMVVRKAQTSLITDPKEIKKLEKEYSVKVDDTKIIYGVMACLGGIIRGRAKICLDKHEIRKVKSGDILVAQYTTPDFVPAMEKAVAIVADQGGLSSHAAIVSRELGVPCVIATKNGTRIIHDNDLLEIDARKGIVKILERS